MAIDDSMIRLFLVGTKDGCNGIGSVDQEADVALIYAVGSVFVEIFIFLPERNMRADAGENSCVSGVGMFFLCSGLGRSFSLSALLSDSSCFRSSCSECWVIFSGLPILL